MLFALMLTPLFLLWQLSLVIGAIVFFWRRLRYLSSYLVLGSTGVFIGASGGFVCVLVLFGVWAWLTQRTHGVGLTAALLVLTSGIALGGFLGYKGGMKIARYLNQSFCWSEDLEANSLTGDGPGND